MAHGVEHAFQIHIEQRVPFGVGRFVNGLAGRGDPGVVVDGIKAAITFHGPAHGSFYFGIARDVANNSEVFRAEFRHGFIDPSGIAGEHHDFGALVA